MYINGNTNNDTQVEIKEAVDSISAFVWAHLKAYEVDLSSNLDETEKAVLYATHHLNLQKEGYKKIR